MKPVMPDAAGIAEAAAAIASGHVVAYPTETVYGLGTDPFSEQALDHLFHIKARDEHHPVLLIVADARQALTLTDTVSPRALACIQAFWPGPLSLLLPAVPGIPNRLLDASGHVCVRCPGHEIARELCRRVAGPITSTSANLSGMPPARTAQDAGISGVTLVLEGGTLNPSPPSTVYDPETNSILRPGPVTMEMIEAACR